MNLKMDGEGKVEQPNNEGAIEYGVNSIEDMVEEVDSNTVDPPLGRMIDAEDAVLLQTMDDMAKTTVIDATKASIDELLPDSDKPGFDDSEAQDARKDSSIEGGVTNPKASGMSMKTSGDPLEEGGQVKVDHLADSKSDVYEVSGFHIEIPSGSNTVTQQITKNFKSLEAAKACVNNEMYLHVADGEIVIRKIIRGAPIVCYNERQLLEYIGGKWRKP